MRRGLSIRQLSSRELRLVLLLGLIAGGLILDYSIRSAYLGRRRVLCEAIARQEMRIRHGERVGIVTTGSPAREASAGLTETLRCLDRLADGRVNIIAVDPTPIDGSSTSLAVDFQGDLGQAAEYIFMIGRDLSADFSNVHVSAAADGQVRCHVVCGIAIRDAPHESPVASAADLPSSGGLPVVNSSGESPHVPAEESPPRPMSPRR